MEKRQSKLSQILWLVVIWAASILALGAVSMVLRLLMTSAGLKYS